MHRILAIIGLTCSSALLLFGLPACDEVGDYDSDPRSIRVIIDESDTRDGGSDDGGSIDEECPVCECECPGPDADGDGEPDDEPSGPGNSGGKGNGNGGGPPDNPGQGNGNGGNNGNGNGGNNGKGKGNN